MPRASRLLAITAAVVLGLAATITVVAVGGARTARAATTWPAHVFAPYVVELRRGARRRGRRLDQRRTLLTENCSEVGAPSSVSPGGCPPVPPGSHPGPFGQIRFFPNGP